MATMWKIKIVVLGSEVCSHRAASVCVIIIVSYFKHSRAAGVTRWQRLFLHHRIILQVFEACRRNKVAAVVPA